MEYQFNPQIMLPLMSIAIIFSINYNPFCRKLNLSWIAILSVHLVNTLQLMLLNANHVSLLFATNVLRKMISNVHRVLAVSNWATSQEKYISYIDKYLHN